MNCIAFSDKSSDQFCVGLSMSWNMEKALPAQLFLQRTDLTVEPDYSWKEVPRPFNLC